jgi:hypothetical protein
VEGQVIEAGTVGSNINSSFARRAWRQRHYPSGPEHRFASVERGALECLDEYLQAEDVA